MQSNKSAVEAKWKKVRDGVAEVLPAGTVLVVDGQSYSQAQLLAKIDGMTSLFTTAESAKGSATAAVQAVRQALPANLQWMVGLVAVLKHTLGVSSPLLAAFGLGPKGAKVPRTAQQKALSAAKQSATRKVRHVLGAKQRAAIPRVQNLELQVVTQGAGGAAGSVSPTPPTPPKVAGA